MSYNCFERTALTAHIRAATAKVYYAYRVYYQGEDFRTKYVKDVLQRGLEETKKAANEILEYKKPVPEGQWNWGKDYEVAQKYIQIVESNESF